MAKKITKEALNELIANIGLDLDSPVARTIHDANGTGGDGAASQDLSSPGDL